MNQTAAIIGLAGPELLAAEAAMLRDHQPVGVILFSRNITDPAQLADLIAAVKQAAPGVRLVIDQEGGRVARLRSPHWPLHPSAATIGALPPQAAARAAFITGALIGLDCAALGIDVVCAPVLDLAIPGQTKAIGDRAYAADPRRVASLGRAMAEGLMAAGVQPVMKHLPGHGRARQDSHVELPVVTGDITQDLVPFARNADLGWAMTAHVLYPALDPDCPATLSRPIIQGVIRDRIGFEGVLISDDLAMHALAGRPEARAAAAITAGCDLAMHCDGAFAASLAVLRASGRVSPTSQDRLDAAPPEPERLNRPALTAEREALLA